MTVIAQERLLKALTYYRGVGYQYRDVPWIVSKEAYNSTKPAHIPEGNECYVEALGGYLVASGEQGFVEVALREGLFGRYCCITPCFRKENYDALHLPYFSKLELYSRPEVDLNDWARHLDQVVYHAFDFFTNLAGIKVRTEQVGESCGLPLIDIVCEETDIELGSYGVREFKDLKWVFGTGLAEPRATQTLLTALKKAINDAFEH